MYSIIDIESNRARYRKEESIIEVAIFTVRWDILLQTNLSHLVNPESEIISICAKTNQVLPQKW